MHDSPTTPVTERQGWMAVLARASAAEMRACLDGGEPLPAHVRLRGPEFGLVMVRGRAGGSGMAFNLGEMTVTRCTVRAETGEVGHATITGRDMAKAELAARLDAALQDSGCYPDMQARVIAPLRAAQAARREATARRAAATQVRFFTMATMRT